MDFILTQFINGLAFGILLFMMAAGLSLIFGLMNVINVAHGSFFMLGAFTAYSTLQWSGNFWLALGIGWDTSVVAAVLLERYFIRSLYNRGHIDQALLTLRFIFVLSDLPRANWGTAIVQISPPASFDGVHQLSRN